MEQMSNIRQLDYYFFIFVEHGGTYVFKRQSVRYTRVYRQKNQSIYRNIYKIMKILIEYRPNAYFIKAVFHRCENIKSCIKP